MRFSISLMVCAFVLCGCGSTPKKEKAAAVPKKEAKAAAGSKKEIKATVAPQPTKKEPATRPVDKIGGQVITVRPDLRFVIVDFSGQRLPTLDQKLSVYRLDQKVAEIKISGPYRGTTVAADITAGDVKYGDFVRQD